MLLWLAGRPLRLARERGSLAVRQAAENRLRRPLARRDPHPSALLPAAADFLFLAVQKQN
jgi:hypothetical protein